MGTWSLLLDARPEDEESPEENRFAVLFRKPECTSKDSKPIKYEQARALVIGNSQIQARPAPRTGSNRHWPLIVIQA